MKRWGIAVAAVVASATSAGAMVGEGRESAGSANKQAVVAKAGEDKKLKPAPVRKETSLVEVKLDVFESLERLQERRIKEPRRIKAQP